MSEMENKVNLSSYKKEMKDVLQRLVKTMPAYKELRFFVACVINHYLTDLGKDSSDIVVIGSNIPEELVLASGKMPCWILGGSRVSSIWADDMVPGDTDPVSRSGLGYILSGFAKKSLILIPLVSDSTRKLAYILKSRGINYPGASTQALCSGSYVARSQHLPFALASQDQKRGMLASRFLPLHIIKYAYLSLWLFVPK